MSNVLELVLWVVGSVTLALTGLFVTRKFIKSIDVEKNSEFLIATVTIVGTLISVVLGLLVSSSVDQYREMESSIDAEATSIEDIFRLARGLPEKTKTVLESLCIDYCHETVSDEWPSMKQRQPSQSVTNTFAKLNDIIVGFHPTTPDGANIQLSMLRSLERLAHSRRQRVVAVQSDWMKQLLPILLMCAFIVIVLSYLYVQNKPSKLDAILVSFIAIALGSNIGLMLILSAPLSQDWNVAPEEFEVNARVMQQYKNTPLFSGQ
jgi:hypothetical protein